MRKHGLCSEKGLPGLRIFLSLTASLLAGLFFLHSKPFDQKDDRWQGTLNYQRTVGRQLDLSNSSYSGTSRINISDSATLNCQLVYYRSSDGIDYYALDSLMAPYTVGRKEIQTLTPKNLPGPSTTITYTANCTDLLIKDGVRVYLSIDRKNKVYYLSCDIISPWCDGIQARDGNPISRWTAQINGSLDASPSGYQGRTDGRTVVGSLTRPENGGSALWSWSFSGVAIDTEAVIEMPKSYESWRPEAGRDETTRGNDLDVKVRVQKKGEPGKPSPRKAKFKFELVDVSKEKGTCLNWPAKGKDSYDLKIEPKLNGHLKINGPNGLVAESNKDLERSSVRISCFDWGAYGKLKVTALLDDGTEIPAQLEKDSLKKELTLPQDENENQIADWWEKKYGMSDEPPDSDDDFYPVGDFHRGDGLSLYEEYRGFMVKGQGKAVHISTNPDKKDLFILNEVPDGKAGIDLFHNATGIETHEIQKDQMDASRVINFNLNPQTFVVFQHALRMKATRCSSQGRQWGGLSSLGPPKKVDMVEIRAKYELYYGDGKKYTIAHELGHAVCLDHHGDGNYFCATGDKNPGCYYLRKQLAKQDPGIKMNDIYIAVQQGENSGVEDCLMRYVWAHYFARTENGTTVYYSYGDPEKFSSSFCTESLGTGVNARNHKPFPKAGDAQAGRGICFNKLCVNDNYH